MIKRSSKNNLIVSEKTVETIKTNEPIEAIENVKPATLTRIFFARIIDIILSLFPSLAFSLFYHVHDWKSALIVITSSLGLLFFYFILLAHWCRGNTLGKLILGIKTTHQDGAKITFRDVFLRELYHTLVPWIIQLALQIAVILIAIFENSNGSNNYWNTFCFTLQNIGFLSYFVWFLYIWATVQAQAEHQSGVDFRLKIFVVYIGYSRVGKIEKKPLTRHVHLDKNMPGNIDISELDKMLEDKADE